MRVDIENKLSSELQGKRLICEAEFNEEEVKGWLETIIFEGIDSWITHPALSAVITTATGIYEYKGGDFWTAFSEFFPTINKTEWGRRFNKFIRNHDTLESFQDLQGHKYVARILAHGGIPRYCLPDFFHLLVSLGDPEQPGPEFIENIRHEKSLKHVDKPVRRFLSHGGEVAEEFVTRCLALWLASEKGGSGTHGLPKRVADAFSEWYRENPPNPRSGQRFPKPQVRISPQNLWVYLYLPRCDNHPEIDQNTCWEAIGKKWAVSREHHVPLSLNNKWVIKCNGREVVLKGINDSEPVMFFDPDNGKVIPDLRVRQLPENLWAVLEKSLIVKPVPVIKERVPGWQDHDFIVLDLAEHLYVKIGEKSYAVRRPFFHISHDPTVKGVTGANNLPVYYQSPNIDWKGKANFSLIQDGKNTGNIDIRSDQLKIWFDKPGAYEFHLRGPIGHNIHKKFVMIPNLNLDIRPPIMGPDTHSLECNVTADQVEICDLEGRAPPFQGHYCSSFTFKVLRDGIEEELVTTVPRLQWRALTAVKEEPWRNEPITLSIHELETAEHPRLVCKIDPMTIDMSVTLDAEDDPTNTPNVPQNQQYSSDRKQNFWSFDLRTVCDQIRQSGKSEKFKISVRATDGAVLYDSIILTVRPEWDLQDFRAELNKTTSSIRVGWKETGPAISGRWLILIPLWRPWESPVQKHELSATETWLFEWPSKNIRPGRYIVRAVHAPWGHDNWFEAEYLCQKILDIKMGALSATFECENNSEKTIETYCEHLLAHWYIPEEVKKAPDPPLKLTHKQIVDFLGFLQLAKSVEWLRNPIDGSSPSIFHMNSRATTEAVEGMEELPDIGSVVLSAYEIISLDLGERDKKFVEDIVYNYTELDKSPKAVRTVKNKNKRKYLSEPMQEWHRNLSTEKPPLGGIFFLCEKFDLCTKGVSQTIYKKLK